MFTNTFYDWAENISHQAKRLIEQELKLRREFTEKIDSHFLRCFFPGMNDMPENFINEPIRIDQSLPHITMDDVEHLRNELPEMFDEIVVPSIVPDIMRNEIAENVEPVDHSDIATMTELSLFNIEHLEMNELNMGKFVSENNEIVKNLKENLNITKAKNENQRNLLKRLRSTFIDLIEFCQTNQLDDLKQQLSTYGQDFFNEIKTLNTHLNEISNTMNQLQSCSLQDKQTIIELNAKIEALENQVKLKNSHLKACNQKLSEEKIKN
ncbi:hypothetical protein BLA29_007950 [Euroglyphus maynei]|uniref:Uncharacterized protein n=1 Tax=Euroglyphus maynei TaxID=6958 RepID=A0A1Y3AZN0_EURMA|nr:hypothetical protein BLA29_007950 [Euroglyphus maynei]